MKNALQQLIRQSARDSHTGMKNFAAHVGRMAETGVESYHADYRTAASIYYMPDGDTCVVPLEMPDAAIPPRFDEAALKAAIRGAQRGEVLYPEFLQRSMAAGCVGYICWIAGRQVSYFGHRGEIHIEPFPN